MDTRSRDVEVVAHEGQPGVDRFSDGPVVVGDLGDGGRVHPVEVARQRDEPERERFDRRVARAFADAQQRAVVGRRAIEPRRDGVGDDGGQVVLAVVLEALGRHSALPTEDRDQTRDPARESGVRVGDTDAERVG